MMGRSGCERGIDRQERKRRGEDGLMRALEERSE